MTKKKTHFLQTLIKRSLLLFALLSCVYGCNSNEDSSESHSLKEALCTIDTRGSSSSQSSEAYQSSSTPQAKNWPQNLKYKLIKKHSIESPRFTQGLQYQDGRLYESSGLFSKSFISVRDFPAAENGAQSQSKVRLDDQFFAEGLTLHKEKLYQLTWKSGKVFTYDPITLNLSEELSLMGEGWGITSDGDKLYISNGSATIQVVDEQLATIKTIEVTLGPRKLQKLNELEWVNGCLIANIWKSSSIVVIDPANGEVTAIIDADALVKEQQRIYQQQLAAADTDSTPLPLDVLNGIAYREDANSLLITGKYWSTIYEIKIDTSTSNKL